MLNRKITLASIPEPQVFESVAPTFLNDETITERKQKLLQRMSEENFDALVIYADKEHAGNFEYLTGFIPRFEEGLLVVEKPEKFTLILGNENLKLCAHARVSADLIHYPQFSLPNQPMENEKTLESIFRDLDIGKKKRVGVVGWKMFTTKRSNPATLFDVPYFIVDALKNTIAADCDLVNGAYLMIGDGGARTTNNANEIAHYEYGANLSSSCMLRAMNAIEPGRKETEIGNLLNADGQYNSVVTIAAAGQRFEFANLYPTHKEIQLGTPMSLTTGFKGGLSSRTGFVIEQEEQLPEQQRDYLEAVAKPYFAAIVSWLENIKVGMAGNELYQLIEDVFPKDKYHWHLNPGHLTADEEWMSSPIYADSSERLKSGMILQIDIIPSVSGYAGVSAEECVAIADENLQHEIQKSYPELWERISVRRGYLKKVLNINLSADVLPLSNTVAYLRPFYLAKDKAFKVE